LDLFLVEEAESWKEEAGRKKRTLTQLFSERKTQNLFKP